MRISHEILAAGAEILMKSVRLLTLLEAIRDHPLLEWKALNVRQHKELT